MSSKEVGEARYNQVGADVFQHCTTVLAHCICIFVMSIFEVTFENGEVLLF